MLSLRRFALLTFTFLLPAVPVSAQKYFSECAVKTGRSASLILPADINPSINGKPMSPGSEIAVFTPEGACAGSVVWQEESTSLTVWGNDSFTSEKEGLDDGDVLTVQVWDAAAKKLFVGPELVQVDLDASQSYFRTAPTFAEHAIFRMASLSIDTRQAPAPLGPENGSNISEQTAELQWKPAEGAMTYHVQVAKTSTLNDPVIERQINDTRMEIDVNLGQTYYWRIGIDTPAGKSWSETFVFHAGIDDMPSAFQLEQNYPNPFNPSTTIPFVVKEADDISLVVYNMIGQEVTTLVDGFVEAGRHEVRLDADNMPSGTYLYRLRAGRSVQTKMLTLVR